MLNYFAAKVNNLFYIDNKVVFYVKQHAVTKDHKLKIPRLEDENLGENWLRYNGTELYKEGCGGTQ